MKVFTMKKQEFFEKFSLGLENFTPRTPDLELLLKNIHTKYQGVTFGLIDRGESVYDFISNALSNSMFPVFLESKTFTDDKLFKEFQTSFSAPVVFSNFLDTLQGNSPAILKQVKNTKFYLLDLLNFNIMLLVTMIIKMSKKLYGSEVLSYEESDKLTILTTYGVFRYIIGYEPNLAQVYTTDFLNDSKVLLKSAKYSQRVNITIALNRYVNASAKDFFELYTLSGLFSELLSKKQFLQGLSAMYTVPLVKALLVTPGSKDYNSNLAMYVYRGVIISITDILQNLNIYQKLSRNLSSLNPVVDQIINKCIKDEVKSI